MTLKQKPPIKWTIANIAEMKEILEYTWDQELCTMIFALTRGGISFNYENFNTKKQIPFKYQWSQYLYQGGFKTTISQYLVGKYDKNIRPIGVFYLCLNADKTNTKTKISVSFFTALTTHPNEKPQPNDVKQGHYQGNIGITRGSIIRTMQILLDNTVQKYTWALKGSKFDNEIPKPIATADLYEFNI